MTTTPPRPTPKATAARKSQSVTTRARDAANDAGDRIADSVQGNPIGVLAAGIAVGLALGAFLPKTKLEGRYLSSLGASLNETALMAAKAAGEAGKTELAAIGISKVGANEQVQKLAQGLLGALQSAGTAARDSRRNRSTTDTAQPRANAKA